MRSHCRDRFRTPVAGNRHVTLRVFGLVVLLCLSATPLAASALPTVASTNLCADLLLLQVAAPGQVASVSLAAADPALSPLASEARRYPGNRGSVEELLVLRPDIALVYQGWTGRGHKQLLDGRGTQVVPLPYPSGWEGSLQDLRDLAALIGRTAYAEEMIDQAERRMRQLADRTPPLRVLYLRPNGGTAGQDTYVDDLLQRLGLRNLAAEEGLRGWGRFPLERLVMNPPDLFLLGYFDQSQARSKTAFARHPLFREQVSRIPAITVPAGGWGCGGIELVAVAEDIVGQIDDLRTADRK
jgi:iron complex transport system substrate-binding protein